MRNRRRLQFAKSVKLETVLTFDILEEDDGVKRLFTTIVDDVNHLLPALFLHRKKKTYTGNTKMNRKRKYSMVQKRALSNLNTLVFKLSSTVPSSLGLLVFSVASLSPLLFK